MWEIFIGFDYSPQLIRSLIERIALNPGLSASQAQQQVLHDLYYDRNYVNIWTRCSQLEKLLLRKIANGEQNIYSQKTLQELTDALGIDQLQSYTIQSAIKALCRQHLLIKSSADNKYIIEDPNFTSWVLQIE